MLRCVCLMFCATTLAQPPAAPPQPPDRKLDAQPMMARPSRADLAQVYLRFERAMKDHPPVEAEVADVNRAFDAATLQFFGGTYSNSIRMLSETTDRMIFGDAVTSNRSFASSLKISVAPAVIALSEPAPVVVKLEPLYQAQPVGALMVRIIGPKGRDVFSKSTTEPRATFTVDAARFSPGTYRAELVAGDDVLYTARLVVSDRFLADVRAEMLKKLAEAPPGNAAIEQAIAACKARINLLLDAPSVEDSAQFLADPTSLRAELEKEISSLLESRDPYRRRIGDYWRQYSLDGLDVPCRVFAPAAAGGPDRLPVLIALHGAGGDEAMFLDAYGAGVLKPLAEKRGMLVISPRTELLTNNPKAIDLLLAAVEQGYAIDRSRIYILGHSLGAGVAAGLCVQRPDTFAAACLMAGFGRYSNGKTIPPTLAIAGELDPLMKVNQVEAGAAKAKQSGLPVELRVIKGRGHTLVVGEQLTTAIDWLLQHRKP